MPGLSVFVLKRAASLVRVRVGMALLATACTRAEVTVVQSREATEPEQIAAGELIERLQRLYPDERFVRADMLPPSGNAIVLTNAGTNASSLVSPVPQQLQTPESFVISRVRDGDREIGVIAGADPRGVSHGVYAILERLGCGFYLSHETLPPPRSGALTYAEWSLADAPLFGNRIILNWHNFLSSATTWEFEDWRRYIDAAVRLRFNDLMVHAYGNNPMFTFTFNGVTKPVGYFATTERGRDWGTQHVNDVRRMIGGELFDGPVFGASVAQTDPAHRIEATTALMQRVFAYARSRGLDVTFALDVDTAAANPREVIATLPAAARFRSGDHELANPDTAEGFAYYRAQVEQLLARYSDITRVAVWFRSPDSQTPWRTLQRGELPAAWQREFDGRDEDVSAFALAKVVHAFDRALRETGRTDVQLAAGSWAFPFLEASDRYLRPDIPLIALDWWVSFDSARALRDLQRVRPGRPLVPIVWAHHDDRTYVGRPYTPFVDFATKLRRINATGFGVLHWTTRPLDLYFKSTVAQTWQRTADEPLQTTCDEMAARLFGPAARRPGGDYLFTWVTEAPMFGRETTAHFIDHPLPTPELHVRLARARLAQLTQLAALQLAPAGRTQLEFYRRYEQFIVTFFEAQTAAERAATALQFGNQTLAREAARGADPAPAIRAYVAAITTGDLTPGEKALLVSLNLRWRPHLVSLRQATGLEPIRYRLGEVQQEPLAQGAYPGTYFLDEERRLWKVLDRASLPPVVRLTAISGEKLTAGRYVVAGVGDFEPVDGTIELPRSALPDEIVISAVESTAR